FLDQLTQGRAYLGLARGAWLDRIGVAQHRPVETLREAILTIKSLLGGEELQYKLFRRSIPIAVGTWGRLTARLAGELANEVKIGGSTNGVVAEMLLSHIRDGEQLAKRSVGSVGVCLGAVTVVDNDGALAREVARREVAL